MLPPGSCHLFGNLDPDKMFGVKHERLKKMENRADLMVPPLFPFVFNPHKNEAHGMVNKGIGSPPTPPPFKYHKYFISFKNWMRNKAEKLTGMLYKMRTVLQQACPRFAGLTSEQPD